ncbi:MAG: hypothetical protein C4554_02265 [Dethiobacter sp.]|jgi:site-specific recombinase XerD|nr:MAG: hypothetical protein C4554_02265 [Dethiobacter sp.]
MKTQGVISVVKHCARLAGIQRTVTPTLLRHSYSFCSHLVAGGADPFSTWELMGHKKVLTTLHYYTHLSRDQVKEQMLTFNPLQEKERCLW